MFWSNFESNRLVKIPFKTLSNIVLVIKVPFRSLREPI